MTVIKVHLQACRLNVYNKQAAGEPEDPCKLILSTESITRCLKLAEGRLLFIYFSFGEGGMDGASSCLSVLSPSWAKPH